MQRENFEFKKDFIERYSKLTNFEEFKKFSTAYIRKSIRVNTLKISIEKLKKKLKKKNWQLTQIPWCKEGFWIEHKERRDIGNLLEHQLGYIYVQDSVSMVPPIVLDPKSNQIILDIAASPGSKTTQIAQYMNNTGILVANDIKPDRIRSLGINTQRLGISNCIVTITKGQKFKEFQFDKILVDAPCSGTGIIRKSFKTIFSWNYALVTRLSKIQLKLLQTAFENLKQGGEIVYSTCSLEPEEDEGVIHNFLEQNKNAKLEKIPGLPGLKRGKPIIEFEGKKFTKEVEKTIRIWPQDNDTEGFFIAKIKKE